MSPVLLPRRTILSGLATLPLAAACPVVASVPAGFVALGDWGRRGALHQRQVAAAMAQAAHEIDSRFVISTGDNFYPAGVGSVRDPHWTQSFEDVYAQAPLRTPWYVALGNHDYRGHWPSQVHYTHHSDRWRLPHRFYKVPSRDLGIAGLDLFVIDTTSLVELNHEVLEQAARGHLSLHSREHQLRWIEAQLARSDAPWKIVVGHHPVCSGAHGDDPVLIARLKPLLERYGVQVYLNGHDHDLQHIRRGPVSYVCSGAGSDGRPVQWVEGTQFCLGQPGFATFRLLGDVLALEFRDRDGRPLHQALIPRSQA